LWRALPPPRRSPHGTWWCACAPRGFVTPMSKWSTARRGKARSLARIRQARRRSMALASPAGLTRGSILFVKDFLRRGWIAGSSPAMTREGLAHVDRVDPRASQMNVAEQLSSLSAAIRAAKGRPGCRRDPRRGIPPRGWRSFLDVGRGAPLLAHRNQGLDALHLETEMIDPLLELIAFDLAFGADRDDRQVDVTVGQIGGGPHAPDNLEAERIGVEFHQSIHVLRENGEMADAGHGAPPALKSSCRAQPTADLASLTA